MATGTPSTLKMGWMLVLFDLPVTTKRERGQATRFRKKLLDDGYSMLQFSVYMRSCGSWERMQKTRPKTTNFRTSRRQHPGDTDDRETMGQIHRHCQRILPQEKENGPAAPVEHI